MDEHFEVRNKEAEDVLRSIGLTIATKLPSGFGFLLGIFSFGKGGDFFYISNAMREDIPNLLEEFKKKLERKKDG